MSWIFGMNPQQTNPPSFEQPSTLTTPITPPPPPPLAAPSTPKPSEPLLLLPAPEPSTTLPVPLPSQQPPPTPQPQHESPPHSNNQNKKLPGAALYGDHEKFLECLDFTKKMINLYDESLNKETSIVTKYYQHKQERKIKKLEAQIQAMKIDSQLLAEERRKKFVQNIKTKFTTKCVAFGNGIKEFGNDIKGFMADHSTTVTVAGTVTAFVAGWYAAKRGGTGVGAKYPRFAQPSLIRETSRHSITQILRHPIRSACQFLCFKVDPLMNFQFSPYLESRFQDIRSTINYTKLIQGDYKNVHYFGPPETGITVLAKGLAYQTGLDYAIIDGGDVAAKGKEGASAINEVFDWAESSRKGLVLYVDNADAFLHHRATDLSSKNRSAILDAVYSRTRFRSDKFMFIVASQKQEHIDLSLHESMDQHVELELPNRAERESLFLQYFEYYFEHANSRYQDIKIAGFNWREKMKEIAIETHGLSRQEISKLVYNWRTCASETELLTEKMIDSQTADAMRVNKYCTKSRYTNVENAKNFSREKFSESIFRKINYPDFLLAIIIIFYIPLLVFALEFFHESNNKCNEKKSR